jgi:hypothetical protein
LCPEDIRALVLHFGNKNRIGKLVAGPSLDVEDATVWPNGTRIKVVVKVDVRVAIAKLRDDVLKTPLFLVDEAYLLLELGTEVLNDLNQGLDYVRLLLLGCQVDHRPGALDS